MIGVMILFEVSSLIECVLLWFVLCIIGKSIVISVVVFVVVDFDSEVRMIVVKIVIMFRLFWKCLVSEMVKVMIWCDMLFVFINLFVSRKNGIVSSVKLFVLMIMCCEMI